MLRLLYLNIYYICLCQLYFLHSAAVTSPHGIEADEPTFKDELSREQRDMKPSLMQNLEIQHKTSLQSRFQQEARRQAKLALAQVSDVMEHCSLCAY